MLYTVKLFVILAIVGGAIAWLGDVVGARLGKKRSSLFGLRPRQTARLVAVAVGAALPLGGLLVATVTSEYAHKAVFEMEQLVADLEDLKQQVDDFREKAGVARDAATEAQEKAARSAELLIEKEVQVADLTEVQGSLTGQVTGLEGAVAAGEQAVATAQREVSAADTKLAAAKDKLESLTDKVDVSVEEVRQAEERRDRAVEEQEEATLKGDQALARLLTLRRQVEDIIQRDRLITGQPAVFDPGDELMRVTMDADGTQDQMESSLFELLYFAGAVAERRGVPTGDNGRAVTAVAPLPRSLGPEEAATEAAIVRYAASELRTRGPQQWVVIVRTFRRLFAEENTQVQVQFKAAPNVKVFEAGEGLAEIRVPADAKPGDIFKAIYRSITDRDGDLRAMAIARGMLPHPVTGNYGAADLDDIFDAAAEVRKQQGIVTVRAVAARDTFTAGPLLVEVQVGEGSP